MKYFDENTDQFINPIEGNNVMIGETGLIYSPEPIIQNSNLEPVQIDQPETGGVNMDTDFSGADMILESMVPVTGMDSVDFDPTNNGSNENSYTFGEDSEGFENLTKEQLDLINKSLESGEVTLEEVTKIVNKTTTNNNTTTTNNTFTTPPPSNTPKFTSGGGGGSTFQTEPTSTGAGAGEEKKDYKFLIYGLVGSVVLIILFVAFGRRKGGK